MPRVSSGRSGVLTIRIEIRDTEHPALYRELVSISSGTRRRVRLFSLAHMGLALEMSGAGTRDRTAETTAATDGTTPENRLSTSELADLFGETSTQLEDQGA